MAAAGGGDGGSSGGSSGGSGGSGGGGGDDGEEAEKKPVFGWKGWQDRVAADPQFVYKVVVEQVRTCCAPKGTLAGANWHVPNWHVHPASRFALLWPTVGPACEAGCCTCAWPRCGFWTPASSLEQATDVAYARP